MSDTLQLLYDRFYIPLSMVEVEQKMETYHRQLIKRLEKPEIELVLGIMDVQNRITEDRSMDSFL